MLTGNNVSVFLVGGGIWTLCFFFMARVIPHSQSENLFVAAQMLIICWVMLSRFVVQEISDDLHHHGISLTASGGLTSGESASDGL